MVSSFTEGHIKKLRRAGYLPDDIAHRLPNEGQLIPTPRPHERVVFLTHFLCGLGFPLHPFIRGLMFYYGLDFHDLAPNFILNISVFIVVCEVFLRIKPHFGLWLKIFNVKPKVVGGQQAECGGAMVAIWPTSHGSRAPLCKPSKGGNRGGSTSPSRVTMNGQRPPNSNLASPHGSPPEKGWACRGVIRKR